MGGGELELEATERRRDLVWDRLVEVRIWKRRKPVPPPNGRNHVHRHN